jgi:UDP-GlcNAc:undecaprenyl-phosphate GlcNAc-1-phosphate transferase
MWNAFTAHLDVLWGFLVAFVVVVVLTPAVGRVARVLGVVDEPGEARRMHLRAVPRLGGLAIFLGIFIPGLAFLDLGALKSEIGEVKPQLAFNLVESLGGNGALIAAVPAMLAGLGKVIFSLAAKANAGKPDRFVGRRRLGGRSAGVKAHSGHCRAHGGRALEEFAAMHCLGHGRIP